MKDRKIKLACPACERKLKLGDSHIDKPIVCPKCNTRFKVNNSLVAEIIGRGHQGSRSTMARQDKEVIGEPSEVNAAFEDIDSLFTSNEIASHAQQIETHASKSAIPDANHSDVASEWQKEKRVMSRGDERLSRNGVGLLILATGLALLPIFGASVPELSWVLPYLPLAALAVAVIGTFLFTYSKRRSGFGSIILSLFPLVFISLASAGGYLYLEYLNPISKSEVAKEEAGDLEPAADDRDDEFDNGLITIDRDSINQNPAAKFVPPAHDAVSDDHKPSQLANADQPHRVADGNKIAENDSMIDRPQRNGNSLPIEPTAIEPADQQPKPQISKGAGKRDVLLHRIDQERMKALVSKGEFRVQSRNNYSFSKIAGETTVYGFALKSDANVRGFDFIMSENNPTVEMVVPVSTAPEFIDSQVVDEPNQQLVGVNIHRQPIGIVGLQAIFANSESDTAVGEWIGIAPEADEFMTVRSEWGKLAGFVMYRNGMRTVGFGLVTRQ